MTGYRDKRQDTQNAVRPDGVSADSIVRVFRVAPELAGMRLDVFLSGQLRNTSRTRAKRIAENGAFTLDGRPLRPSERLRPEDRVAIWRHPVEERDEPADLPIVHEDEHLLVLDKPPLMTVHPTARHHHVTVIKLLEAERPNEHLALIHRLDRETSGILMVARSREGERAFKRYIEGRSVAHVTRANETQQPIRKTYLAITWGVPEPGLIELPLEPDDDNPLRVKMRVAPRGRGLAARTRVEVLETASGYGLLSCELLTGRQHQIRAHLAAVGCPIVGDKLYGPDDRMLARAADGQLTEEDLARLELPRHALHAHRYELPHAISGVPLALEAPLPADLDEFWAERAARAG